MKPTEVVRIAAAFVTGGGATKSKIVKADFESVKRTISFIMAQDKVNQIEIADANFGIFDEDVEYMRHLVKCQNKRDVPINLVFGGMAKNGSRHAEKILSMMYEHFEAYHNRKYVKLSFQSHDDEVLTIAQRSNIKNEKLFLMAKKFRKEGVGIDAEMIIGLPGDNANKWLNSIQVNMNLEVNHQKSFVLFVVPNTDLASAKYKRKYAIKTKKIMIPHDLYHKRTSDYHKSRKLEITTTGCNFLDPTQYQSLEFIYECFSYDSEELMKIYDIWFWFNTLYNANVARLWMLKSVKSAHDQYAEFMFNIKSGRMPFFAGLLANYRFAVWNTLIKPEEETKVKNLFLTNFVVKFGFRGNEVVNIYENQDQASWELKKIYPGIEFSHFNNDLSERDKLKLYFVAADVTV